MKVPNTEPIKGCPVDPAAQWRNFTEDLIFAAAYADDPRTNAITWLRCFDARKIRNNPEDEARKCLALCAAINDEFSKYPTIILRAHAASAHPTFRIRYAHLLPSHP